MTKKLLTFAILKEDTPATDKDLKTKLRPGVYMGLIGDERQETMELIHSLEDDEQYEKDLAVLNAEIEKEAPGHSLPPQSRVERMERARELRAEIGIGVDEVLEIGEQNELE